MTTLAIIPARAGSKGIPGKNIIDIDGLPLLGRTILAAKACPLIDDVLVSTDGEEIADVGRAYGASIIDRPADIAGDTASSESAVQHACQEWTRQTGKQDDLVLLIQNTSPFHDPSDMAAVITCLAGGRCNSCITVTETYKYFWAEGPQGWTMPHQKRGRRQSRKPWHEEAGSLYCTRRQQFCDDLNLFAPPVGAVIIPQWRAFEVDEPCDVEMARLLCKLHEPEGLASRLAASKSTIESKANRT